MLTFDRDLYAAVAQAYREQRQAGALDHPAIMAAKAVYIERTGDTEGAPANVPRIIAWAAENHPKWFWQGVGGRGQV